MDYAEYLRSAHWTSLKNRWDKSDRQRCCTVCGDPDYQLHHKTYERLGRERLSDLEPLCEYHHRERQGIDLERPYQAFRRTQRNYRKIFIRAFGLFVNHYCFFCGEKLDGHVRPYDSTAVVVHHQDGYRVNNHPLNLKPAHLGCHTRYHAKLTVYGEGFRKKMSEIVGDQWNEMDAEVREKRAEQARRALQRPWKKSREEVLANRSAGLRRAYEDPAKRLAISERQKGEKNQFYGKTHSPENREKMREGQKKAPRGSCVRCQKILTTSNLGRHVRACKADYPRGPSS